MAPPNNKTNSKSSVDPAILDAIRTVIKEENKMIYERLDKIEKNLESISELTNKVAEIENSIQFVTDQVEDLNTRVLPDMAKHNAEVATAQAMYMLDLDVHRRKWSLLIHGIKGQAGEDEGQTRRTVQEFAKNHLKVAGADSARFSACHRLSQQPNSGIIIRFCELSERNAWLYGARHLRNHPDKITVSPDLPPVLRRLKSEMLEVRKSYSPEVKAKSRVHYLKQWPYVELRTEGRPPHRPESTMADIVKDVLKMDPVLQFNIN